MRLASVYHFLRKSDERRRVVAAMRELDRRGMNHGSSGNISLRKGAGALITPTGVTAEALRPEEIVELDLAGEVCSAGTPSSEWRFHVDLLSAWSEVGAVVHTHSDACVALSCLRRPIPPFHYMIASFGGDDVRCAKYSPFGSAALSQAALQALEGRKACLLANHGMITVGDTLKVALGLALKLETLARQYILTQQAGQPVILESDDMDEIHRRYGRYGRQRLSA